MTVAATVAVYDALMAAGIAVHDHLPDGMNLPAVTIGACHARPWGAKSFTGYELRFVLDGWSDAAGRHEIETVMETVRAALLDPGFEIAGWRVVLMTAERLDILRETDGGMFHGIAGFRLLMHGDDL